MCEQHRVFHSGRGSLRMRISAFVSTRAFQNCGSDMVILLVKQSDLVC